MPPRRSSPRFKRVMRLVLLAVTILTVVYMSEDRASSSSWLPSAAAAPRRLAGQELQLGQPGTAANGAAGSHWKKLEWLHIPKAGTSFGNTLFVWACPELAPRLWVTPRGHPDLPQTCLDRFRDSPESRKIWSVGDHVSLTGRSDEELRRVFALVRSPKTRLLSGYMHSHAYKQLDVAPVEVCKRAVNSTKSHVATGAQVRMIIGDPIKVSGTGNELYRFHNLRYPTAADAEEACRRVALFAFLGISDHWNASICLFHAQHGGQTHDFEYANVRQGKHRDPSAPDTTTREVDCNDTADERLYECSMQLFLDRLKQHPHCLAQLDPQTVHLSPLAEAAAREAGIGGGGSSSSSGAGGGAEEAAEA